MKGINLKIHRVPLNHSSNTRNRYFSWRSFVIGLFVILIIKPLTMIQAVCIPWLWFVGLQQWTEPNFGADEQSNGFPRWACALISSGKVVFMQKNDKKSDQKSNVMTNLSCFMWRCSSFFKSEQTAILLSIFRLYFLL